MTESIIAIIHPIGHAHHIPIGDFVKADKTNARQTRSIRSVNVAIINGSIALNPRNMPSATSFVATIK